MLNPRSYRISKFIKTDWFNSLSIARWMLFAMAMIVLSIWSTSRYADVWNIALAQSTPSKDYIYANGKLVVIETTGNLQPTPTPTPSPSPSPTPANGNGTGLTGQYFDNIDFTRLFTVRTDASINFNWNADKPSGTSLTSPEKFSVRWSGQIQPRYTEAYTFYTNSDDGVRLSINGQQIINNWTDHAPVENSGTISLTAGQKYAITLDYYDNSGGSTIQLSWSSTRQGREIVPQQQLYPLASPPTAESVNFNAEYVTQTVNSMEQYQQYWVSVRMRNNGNVTWDAGTGYALGSQYPENNTTWGVNRVTLPHDVWPGGEVSFDFIVTAPAGGSDYYFQWRMVQDSGAGWFGAFSELMLVSVSIPDSQIDMDGDGYTRDIDCNDWDALYYPGSWYAYWYCDTVDMNCNGEYDSRENECSYYYP
jgi:hypothetical protein